MPCSRISPISGEVAVQTRAAQVCRVCVVAEVSADNLDPVRGTPTPVVPERSVFPMGVEVGRLCLGAPDNLRVPKVFRWILFDAKSLAHAAVALRGWRVLALRANTYFNPYATLAGLPREPDTFTRGGSNRFWFRPMRTISPCRYVERNALRANLVEKAQEWRWGSLWRRQFGPLSLPGDWVQRVNEPETPAELEAIRNSVVRGAPYGSVSWIEKTAKRFGLESTLRPRGRPRKSTEDLEP